MNEFTKHRGDEHPDLGEFEDEGELYEFLEKAAYYIGRVIIEFNALESIIEYFLAENISHAGNQDNTIYIFLSEMMYKGKAKSLINLYGQIIEYADAELPQEELLELQKRLEKAGEIRNDYAHAHWQEIYPKGYVKVKTRASRKGVLQKYRLFDIEKMEKDLDFIMETPSIVEEFDENIADLLCSRK